MSEEQSKAEIELVDEQRRQKKDHLSLWDSVSKTDPRYTKTAKKGQFRFTSISPAYQAMRATAVFGIQGIGWGVKPESESFKTEQYDETFLIHYDAILYFKYNGEEGQIPIHASEKICYRTQGANGYLKIDDEVRKKVVTNAKTKGLSELGFSADVFLGEFDDPNYIDSRNIEVQIEQAEESAEEHAKQVIELQDWCRREVSTYKNIPHLSTLPTIYNVHVNKLNSKCAALGLDSSKYISQFTKEYEARVSELRANKAEKENG